MRIPAILVAVVGALTFGTHASLAETAILYSGPPPAEGGLQVLFDLPVIPKGKLLKVIFELHASAYRPGPSGSTDNPNIIGVCFKPEAACEPAGTAKIFANLSGVHMTLTPAFFQQNYSAFVPKNQGLFFAPMDNTIWDANDNIRVLAHWDQPQ